MSIMKVAAITAEYNPFHNGHAFQISRTRQAGATHIIAVMSGNYTQRGEPALLEKHVRARAALLGGADLILELPVTRATATAERFASGSIALMQALGCVDMLSFGAESPLDELLPVATALCGDSLGASIREFQRGGRTFAAARALALSRALGPKAAMLVERPNNILAVEYLKAAFSTSFQPEFLAVRRRGAGHNTAVPEGRFASASLLRQNIGGPGGLDSTAPFVPPSALSVYKESAAHGISPFSPESWNTGVLHILRRLSLRNFASLPDISEGLENRLYAAMRQTATVDELLSTVKTKRYTLARIRRLVLSACLGLTERDALISPPYLRVLGFNARGAQILSKAKHTARLPLSSSLARLEGENPACARIAYLEARSTDLYALSLPEPLLCGYDYTCPPVILK